jgi:hypothetical protein
MIPFSSFFEKVPALQALENCTQVGVDVYPAVMVSFSSPENVESLRKRLGKIDKAFEGFEIEELVLYGDVEDRLKTAQVSYFTSYQPDCSPPEQISEREPATNSGADPQYRLPHSDVTGMIRIPQLRVF